MAHPPSVDSLIKEISHVGLPHPMLADAVRQAISNEDVNSSLEIAQNMAKALLQPVINATGVLLHTNLGRAPLSFKYNANGPIRATNVEYDLIEGKRGSRRIHAASLLAKLCGAESALVVNNGASAVLLALMTLASKKQVIISRGELVEIGGGFRIPEVLETSSAYLKEVGTTNKTRLVDYKKAIDNDTALLLKVHKSNYKIIGFTQEVGIKELSSLNIPILADLGSGLLDVNTPWLKNGPPKWLKGEPGVRQSLEDGASLVTFSTDKLLGGPQGGVIAGNKDLVEACATHPLARAVRPGSLILSALQEIALLYLNKQANLIPFWQMSTLEIDELEQRAKNIGIGKILECSSTPGGGSGPGMEIPSIGIAIEGNHLSKLRQCQPPIIARVKDGWTVADLRTVDPQDDLILENALKNC